MRQFKAPFIPAIFLTFTLSVLSACGGGSSDSGILFEGVLTQGETAGHLESLNLRHGAGETIGEVSICALGECSPTDSAGQWGFVAAESFVGGDVLFTLNGHGIDGNTTVSVPQGAKTVEIYFVHGTGNEITVHALTIDGKSSNTESNE